MIGMFKTFAVVGAVGASALMATSPARADHVRVGFGFSVPAVTYAAPVVYQPAYVAPAPVVAYVTPAPTYYTPGYTPYYTPGYSPAVTYVAPPAPTVVYVQPPVVYATPAYAGPVYTYDPIGPVYYGRGIGFDIGFGFGGHGFRGGDFHGGGHRR